VFDGGVESRVQKSGKSGVSVAGPDKKTIGSFEAAVDMRRIVSDLDELLKKTSDF